MDVTPEELKTALDRALALFWSNDGAEVRSILFNVGGVNFSLIRDTICDMARNDPDAFRILAENINE